MPFDEPQERTNYLSARFGFPEQEWRGGVCHPQPAEEFMESNNGEPPVTAEEAARRVREAANGAVQDVKHAAMQGADDARAKAGDMGHTTASRFRELADQVESDLPWLSGAFTKSAEGLDNVTNSLTRGGSRFWWASTHSATLRQPANGCRPASISKSTHPAA